METLKKNLNWFLREPTLGQGVRLLYPTQVIGEKLPDGPFILLVTPHKTAKETFIVPAFLYMYEFAILVKSNAFKWPWAWALKRAGLIPVERQNGRGMASFPSAVAALKEGRSLLVFPESTRHPDDDFVHKGKPGAIYIALAAGVPIVLAGLIGMKGGRRAGRVLNIGETVDVKHELGLLGYAAIGTRVESIVARRLMAKLMRRSSALSLLEYIDNDERDSEA